MVAVVEVNKGPCKWPIVTVSVGFARWVTGCDASSS